MNIKELASTLGEQPKSIRSYLRRTHPRHVDKSRQPWEGLSPELCKEVTAHFNLLRKKQAEKKEQRECQRKVEAKEKLGRKMSKAERIKFELEGRVDIETGELL